MNLKIPNNKAIDILRKRIAELESFNFQPNVWRVKTENDLKEIFPLGDSKASQVSMIYFTTSNESKRAQFMRDGKSQARQLLESYIEQIQEYSKIQQEKEALQENKISKKYADLLEKWNDLVHEHTSLLKEKNQSYEIIERKAIEISNRDSEIYHLKKNTVQVGNISLLKLLKLVFSLPVGQVVAFFLTIIGILTGFFKLGEMYSANKSENEKYDIRKMNDDLKEENINLQLKLEELYLGIDSLEKIKNTTPNI
ncbi:MAG: hypothetical protein WD431_06995 [Cyclobacteriaceae bacterium]